MFELDNNINNQQELDDIEYNKSRSSNLHIKKFKKVVDHNKSIQQKRQQQKKEKIQDVELVISVDNGVTGTIGAISKDTSYIRFFETPVKIDYDYTKEIQKINRIDVLNFKKLLENIINDYNTSKKILVVLERPMVNPSRFKASKSALRAYEATLIILELMNLQYINIDSKQWQHYLFGKNTTLIDLKKQSKKVGLELFPQFSKLITLHGDADSLLISKYIIDKVLK